MPHLRSRVVISVLSIAVAALALLAGSATTQAGGGTCPPNSGCMDSMSVDLNTSVNDSDTLGPTDTCLVATAGSSITIDVTARGIPVSNPMIAFSFYLDYNPSIFQISA